MTSFIYPIIYLIVILPTVYTLQWQLPFSRCTGSYSGERAESSRDRSVYVPLSHHYKRHSKISFQQSAKKTFLKRIRSSQRNVTESSDQIHSKPFNTVVSLPDINAVTAAVTEETNELVTEAETIDYEVLKARWITEGNNPSTFSVQNALLKYFDDDDEDDDDSGIPITRGNTGKPEAIEKARRSLFQLSSQASPPSKLTASSNFKDKLGKTTQNRSVGIDLGTTFSAVAAIEDGRPVIIPVDGRRITPSVVAFTSVGSSNAPMVNVGTEYANVSMLVGELARRQIAVNAANSFSSVKRVIGKSLPQAQSVALTHEKSRLRASSSAGPLSLHCPLLKKQLLPEDISAKIIRVLIDAAQSYLQQKVDDDSEDTEVHVTSAVITVPAYFTPSQCEATKRAGELAGLSRVKLLREPEAAALAYGLTQRQPQIVLVFDLGGGTFDVSVLEVGGGFVEVIATSGDAHLGGDDFDGVVVNWLLDQIAAIDKARVDDVKKDPFAMARLKTAAEQAKIDLSTEHSVQIYIPHLLGDSRLTLNCTMTSGKLESISRKLLSRLLKPMREVAIMAGVNLPGESGQLGIGIDSLDAGDDGDDEELESNDAINNINSDLKAMRTKQLEGRKLAKHRQKVRGKSGQELRRLQKELADPRLAMFPGGQQLNSVLLVGGATRMPAVRRLVRAITGLEPRSAAHVNPDEAVAQGAAVLAGVLDGEIKDMQVVTSLQAAAVRAFASVDFDANGLKM